MPRYTALLDQPHSQFTSLSRSYELNHEAIALLLTHSIKQEKEQCFLLAGTADLIALLPKLHLKSKGDEVFILFRPYIHSMGIYCRYADEQLTIYIFDSQNWGFRYYPTRLLVKALHEYFPMAVIILSNIRLQSQHCQEGCTQYSLNFLRYCAKEGERLIQQYASAAHCNPMAGYESVTRHQALYFPPELQQTAMKVNPQWYKQFREENLQLLDGILAGYTGESGQLNWEQIFATVETMHGLDLPPLAPVFPLAYRHKFIRSTATSFKVELNLQSKDQYLYSNFLLYSEYPYPAQVSSDNLISIFDDLPSLGVIRNDEKFQIRLQSRSITQMQDDINLLLANKKQLWRRQMRQWGALTAFCQSLQQEIALYTRIEKKPTQGQARQGPVISPLTQRIT